MELILEDDLSAFEGGKLSINEENKNALSYADAALKKETEKNEINGNEIYDCSSKWKNNIITPISQLTESIWHKKSNSSSQDETQPPASPSLDDDNANNFFTFREGIVENAVQECADQLLDSDLDGPLIDAFLLTEINLWDTEKERLVLMTPKTLVVVKYDFIALRRLECKKINMDMIDSVIIGELVYPSKSLISNRNMQGIRLLWNKGKPVNFGTKWNPFSNSVPFVTFTSHPLFHHKDCTNINQKKMYNIEEFVQKTCEVITNLERNQVHNNHTCIIEHKNIVLENYVGVGSIIHNKNALGYFKVRGKFSF